MKPETGIISRGFARGKYMFFLSGICCMSYPTRSYLILHVKKKLTVLLSNLVKLLHYRETVLLRAIYSAV